MSEIILRDICKSYENGFQAVKNFNLEIEKGELVVFVGPSGCGKSTTLRMIAGLEDISDGELWIGDKLVNYLWIKGVALENHCQVALFWLQIVNQFVSNP